MYVKKIHQFLSSTKKMHTKENWFLFLPRGVYSCDPVCGQISLDTCFIVYDHNIVYS